MEHIVALFATDASAAAAEKDLEAAGISASSIRRYAPSNRPVDLEAAAPIETTETTHATGGFWAWLTGEETGSDKTHELYTQDANAYDRRVQGGNTLLSVAVHDDSQIHQVITILDAHTPIEVDEHTEESAPSETARTSLSPSGVDYSTAAVAAAPLGTSSPGLPVNREYAGAQGTGVTASSASDEVISLAQEQLEVGKRMVDRGTTRIRRYVVETPVERDVTLHGERVTIERRQPVERAGVAAGAFEERVIEVHETEEVPVVEKTARVVEEVSIRREATERTETIRDTVRREEVEVTGKDVPSASPPA